MEMVIHFILISTMCIVGLIILKRKKIEIEYTKVYLNSIYRNGPTGLILELFQNNKSIKRTGMLDCLIITGIYGNVFYLSRFENNLKISTLNNYDYKPSIDCFISYSKLALGIFDYVYNKNRCEYNVPWVTRYFMTCDRIHTYRRPDSTYDEICLTINKYKYAICLDDYTLYISGIDHKYSITYPQSIKNTKIKQTHSIVFGSFKGMFIRLLKYESDKNCVVDIES